MIDTTVIVDQPLDPALPLGCAERYTFFVRSLARRARVRVVGVGSGGFSVTGLDDETRADIIVEDATTSPVAQRSRLAGRVRNVLHILGDRLPCHAQPRLPSRQLAGLVRNSRSAVILGYRPAHLALALPKGIATVVAVEEAVEHYPNEYFNAGQETWRRLAWRAELRKILRTNRRIDCRASAVVVISDREARFIRGSMPSVPIVVIEHGLDLEYFRPCRDAGQDAVPVDVLVVGDFAGPRNTSGAVEVYKAWRSAHPGRDHRWAFVGPNPPAELRRYAGPCVEVPGYVEDLRPYYARARTVLVPSTHVTGVKRTVLQAWAMGCAVVATTAAAESASALHGVELLVGGTPAELVSALDHVLADGSLRGQLGRNGARHVRERHDLGREAEKFTDLVLSLCDRASLGEEHRRAS